MNLSIVIVNYKNVEKTINCLKSIKASNLGDLSYEIVVVDNASLDNSAVEISSAYPDIKVIKSDNNLGMGGGNNLGIRQTTGEFILVLNPDTLIKDDAILLLCKYLKEHEEVGIVGPKLLNTDGTLQYSCLRFPKIFTPILRRTFLGNYTPSYLNDFLMKDFDHARIKEVDWLMGSCLLIRRDIFGKDKNIFDEKFFMYFEDIDLCRRVQKIYKKKVVYFPSAVVLHDHARQSALRPWYISPFTDKLTREHLKSWFKYFF